MADLTQSALYKFIIKTGDCTVFRTDRYSENHWCVCSSEESRTYKKSTVRTLISSGLVWSNPIEAQNGRPRLEIGHPIYNWDAVNNPERYKR